MRAEGCSFQAIADTLGYSDASGASKAYHRALARRPAQSVDDIRMQESERLEYMWKKVAQVIESPPLVHSAIGKVVPDPRPGREGHFLIDERARIAAVSEYRHCSESFRKLTGADLGSKPPEPDPLTRTVLDGFTAEYNEYKAKAAERDELAREISLLRAQLHGWESGRIVQAVTS